MPNGKYTILKKHRISTDAVVTQLIVHIFPHAVGILMKTWWEASKEAA